MNARAPGATNVYCYPVSRNSTYVPLLFDGIETRYRRVYREDGTLLEAIDELEAGRAVIVHVHWEEFVLRDCRSESEADEAVTTFCQQIARVRELGGAIVWTVHNELPHLVGFHRQFLVMRSMLARDADVVLVHGTHAIEILAAQVALDRSKVVVLPHPSYLDRFEDAAALAIGLAAPHEAVIAGFGWIRLQKGFGEMIGMLPPAFLHSHGARIRISGEDAEAAAVMAQQPQRTDVEWDVRHVPDSETPSLLRSAACLVLPYERVLTSGVVLLAMSVGATIVAVDLPQMRELLPTASRRFLYPRGDGAALRAVIDAVFALSAAERRAIVSANLEVARERHPTAIARRLARIYDDVLARSGRPRTFGG